MLPIDWQRLARNLEAVGIDLSQLGQSLGYAAQWLPRLASGKTKDREPAFSAGVHLLDLHLAHCPAQHRALLEDEEMASKQPEKIMEWLRANPGEYSATEFEQQSGIAAAERYLSAMANAKQLLRRQVNVPGKKRAIWFYRLPMVVPASELTKFLGCAPDKIKGARTIRPLERIGC